MNLDAGNKYKDTPPQNTIGRIKDILAKLGVLAVEQWLVSPGGLYSVRLKLAGTAAGTNGKGTSHEYALASGYAELVERLQNQILYRFDTLGPDTLAYGGFNFAPDEKKVDWEWFAGETGNDLYEHLWPEKFSPDNGDMYALGGDGANGVLSVPLYRVGNKGQIYLPVLLIRMTYGSNGMCAGNTPEEALVQGLSEVIERYVNKRIIKERIALPDIPREYIARFSRMDDVLHVLEKQGRFSVLVKDCSLGEGWPVVAVVLIDRRTQRYLVKFGAHPSFAIALERCFTELFQGRNLTGGMEETEARFGFSTDDPSWAGNLNNIMAVGTGLYPHEFFEPGPGYPFAGFGGGWSGNKGMLRHLTGLLLGRGLEIMVRDVSFLGFPSYQVVVPGLSEVYGHDEETAKVTGSFQAAYRITRDIDNAGPEDLSLLLEYVALARRHLVEANRPVTIMGMHVDARHSLHNLDTLLFSALLHYKLDDYANAHRYISRYVDNLAKNSRIVDGPQSGSRPERITYYRCLKHYLEGRLSLRAPEENRAVLDRIYGRDLAGRVWDDFADSRNLFQRLFGKIPCWDCRRCAESDFCHYSSIRDLHLRLKKRQAENPVEQLGLRNVFDFVS